MAGACVRVAREDGERVRTELAAAGVLDHEREITVEDGEIYIPVTDPDGVPDGLSVLERRVPDRETETMPADLLGFEPSYERLGRIVILDEDDDRRARQIAAAVMDSDLPAKTVVNRASKIKGETRVREWDVLAGDGTETVHREHGAEFALDIAAVYFSPRLATERHRVAEQAREGERVFDMFAGVGPFAVPLAMRGADAVGVDLNPAAVEYLRENAARNGVADRVTAIEGDIRDVAADYRGWADRIVMNLPHSADEFLDTAVVLAGEDGVVHYYDIQHESDPFGPGVAAIRDAATPEYDVAVETERVVRSYAPHELNVVVDIRLRKR
jgi:tRNA (guanine37-N1)-methyltransferase